MPVSVRTTFWYFLRCRVATSMRFACEWRRRKVMQVAADNKLRVSFRIIMKFRLSMDVRMPLLLAVRQSQNNKNICPHFRIAVQSRSSLGKILKILIFSFTAIPFHRQRPSTIYWPSSRRRKGNCTSIVAFGAESFQTMRSNWNRCSTTAWSVSNAICARAASTNSQTWISMASMWPTTNWKIRMR